MIVKCKKLISSTTGEELIICPWLTRERQYIVLALRITLSDGIMIALKSDMKGEPIFVKLEGFEVISQNIPKSWDIFIDNHYYFMMPKSWMYLDFFEELEDGKPKAVELFKKEAEIIYREEKMD